MTVTWPETLPGPLASSLRVSAGTNAARRRTQSGRVEVRRFGAGAPDMVDATFRLLHADVAAFRHFHERTCNLGLNWFTAPWLAALGYLEHCARIVGHPRRTGKGTLYSDYACRLAVRPLAEAWADTFWPAEAIAGPGPEPLPSGVLTGWSDTVTGVDWQLINRMPVGQECTSVSIGRSFSTGDLYAVAARPDGTVFGWASDATFESTVEGWVAGLGNVVQVCADTDGGFYLTGSGIIGHFGSPASISYLATYISYPLTTGVRRILCTNTGQQYSCGVAEFEDGHLELWGDNRYVLPQGLGTPVRGMWGSTPYNNVCIIDSYGDAYLLYFSYDSSRQLKGYDLRSGLRFDKVSLSYARDMLSFGIWQTMSGDLLIGSYVSHYAPADQYVTYAGMIASNIYGNALRGISVDGQLYAWGLYGDTRPTELMGVKVLDFSFYSYATLIIREV